MPTTHDGHRRRRALGLDLFLLVLLGVVVFIASSMVGGLPRYAPALITAAVLLLGWATLTYQGTHPRHRGTHRAR